MAELRRGRLDSVSMLSWSTTRRASTDAKADIRVVRTSLPDFLGEMLEV